MKAIVATIGLLFFLVGCQSRTDFGPCVGIGDKQDPALEYHVSTVNVIVGVVFVETIIPPIVVLLDETYCPIGKVR